MVELAIKNVLNGSLEGRGRSLIRSLVALNESVDIVVGMLVDLNPEDAVALPLACFGLGDHNQVNANSVNRTDWKSCEGFLLVIPEGHLEMGQLL